MRQETSLQDWKSVKNSPQLCYFDRKEREPISVSVKAGSNQYLFPTLLSKKPGKEAWHYGLEADYIFPGRRERSCIRTSEDLEPGPGTEIDGEKYTPGKLMEIYLRGCISLLGSGSRCGRSRL